MNNMIQMLLQQKFQQIPAGMMNQLEQQLKRINPQAYRNYQQARKDNINPNDYLNQITNNFTNEQKTQWGNLTNNFNQK